jgi:hypothetical protein
MIPEAMGLVMYREAVASQAVVISKAYSLAIMAAQPVEHQQ